MTRTARRQTGRERPTLRRALAYSNPQVVQKFVDHWDVTRDEAEELFTETKRLLWLMATRPDRDEPFRMESAFQILDEMWHTFALFTRDYSAYCERLYGRYLHHTPLTSADEARSKVAFERDPERYAKRDLEACFRQWQLIRDHCGEATFLKWYVELPTRYDAAFFRTGAKPLAMHYRPPDVLVQLMERRRAQARRGPGRKSARTGAARRGPRATRATGTDRPRGR